jgi:hypothetical protein
MVWRDYRTGETITYGTKELPGQLIDLVAVQYEKGGKTWGTLIVRAVLAPSSYPPPAEIAILRTFLVLF